MKNEYQIEKLLLEAIGEVEDQWIEQAADYQVTRTIIPFPIKNKYVVVAANLFLCVICAVAFSLTKLNRNTDPGDFDAIFGRTTEEPVETEASHEQLRTQQPDENQVTTEQPKETAGVVLTAEPKNTKQPLLSVNPTSQPQDIQIPGNTVTATSIPQYPTVTPTTTPENNVQTEYPAQREAIPKREFVDVLYNSSNKDIDDIKGDTRPVVTAEPPVITEEPAATFAPEAPEAPPEAPNAPPVVGNPQVSPILSDEYLYTWLNKFEYKGNEYKFYSFMYEDYEIYVATDENSITEYIAPVIVYGTDSSGQNVSVSAEIYKLENIDVEDAVAIRYDGYEEYFFCVRKDLDMSADAPIWEKMIGMFIRWM